MWKVPERSNRAISKLLALAGRGVMARPASADSSRAENVGVLFVDVVGFTALTENLAEQSGFEL